MVGIGQFTQGEREVTLAPVRLINHTHKDNNHSKMNALVNRAISSALTGTAHFGNGMCAYVVNEILLPRMVDVLQKAHACGDIRT